MAIEKPVETQLGGVWELWDGEKLVADVSITRLPDGDRMVTYQQHLPDKRNADGRVGKDDQRLDEQLARDVIFLRGKTTEPLFRPKQR